MLIALPAAASEPRAVFHASKAWADFAAEGVVLRETWLPVDGTALALVHAVRTAEDGFAGALFAADAATGAVWPGSISLAGCPALDTVRTLAVLYRRGGVVLVRVGQGDAVRKPFASCTELYRAGDLAACTLRVPVRADAEEIVSAPDQARIGSGWISAAAGRVDVPRVPNAGLRLTTALRECIGDEQPVIAPLDDRLALAGPSSILLVSELHTSVCTPCVEPASPAGPPPYPADDEVTKRSRSAADAWRAGRRDEALRKWRGLYEAWWRGPRLPSAAWADTLEAFGVALAAAKEPAQARRVLEECWSIAKAPSATLMLNMGDVFKELGDGPAAIAAYEHVLAADATRPQRDHAAAELARLRR